MDDYGPLARLVQALAPWRGHLVLVGGWGHRLYRFHPLANALNYRPLFTRDTDLAFSDGAPLEGDIRAALAKEGFTEELTGEHNPPVSRYTLDDDNGGFYAEFLTPLRGSGTKRGGKVDATLSMAGITAQKLRHLEVLLVEPWLVTIGPDQGFPLPGRDHGECGANRCGLGAVFNEPRLVGPRANVTSRGAVDLLNLFQSLVLPMAATSGDDLSAVPVPGAEGHRLAKDASGSPCILISQSTQQVSSAPIRLENILVSFDVSCTVTQPGHQPQQGTFTIIRCAASTPALFPHFLQILSPMIATLGPTPTRAAVRQAISGLIELFRALTAPAKKTIQGIWGELLLIHLARDQRAMAAAWHRDPLEHYDFAAGPQRIEVKSSSLRRREHHFSLAQLMPPPGTQVLVASLFVERSGGGTSVRELFDEVREHLVSDFELTTHFDATFFSSLGSGWEDAMREAFDFELARDSLAFFNANEVPSVATPTPLSVTNVRFCSDLSTATALRRDEVLASGGLFASGVPH